ncbi:EVE domain-containing protein [Acinetobacter pittii]|uniref:EVE domain-containing protein n=1 Tax=Acinetobacter pittii TaxID=48296 RepID=UPI003AA86F72
MKSWIAVISYEHALIASKLGILQVCHGKKGPLIATHAGDEVFIYCPRTEMRAGKELKLIAFRCSFINNDIYQFEQTPEFKPFRKDVIFDHAFVPKPIKDIKGLELTSNPNWGMLARRGFFEISQHDATLIKNYTV